MNMKYIYFVLCTTVQAVQLQFETGIHGILLSTNIFVRYTFEASSGNYRNFKIQRYVNFSTTS
jgi:hypothetical protein